jgi:predicted ATPase
MSTVPGQKFHGRDAELALVRGELKRVADGAEAAVVVEGAAGMGKSRLLAEVAAIARSLGIKVGVSAADPSETVVELAPLLAALFDGAEPLLDPGSLSNLQAQPEQRFWLLRDLPNYQVDSVL